MIKNIKNKGLLLATCGVFLLNSCSSSYLDATSSDVITPGDMEGDPVAAAQTFLTGAYVSTFNAETQLSHDDFGYKAVQLATDFMSDDIAFPVMGFFQFDYALNNNALTNRRPKSTWGEHYAIIAGTNNIFSTLKDLDRDNLTNDEKSILGQAYAMRGTLYFLLINMFQQPYSLNKEAAGIPIYTEELDLPGRNTVKEVYDLIVSDLEQAYALLEGKGISDPAKMNEFVVAGMLARVYSFMNDRPNQWNDVVKYSLIAAKSRPLLQTAEQFGNGFNTISNVSEALWGSAIDGETSTFYGSFMSIMDPYSNGYGDTYHVQIANDLYNKIPENDLRKQWFLAEDTKNGDTTIPKYTQVKFIDRGNFTSDYIYMRCSEFYYLAAEAYYNLQDEGNARNILEEVMKTRISGYTATGKTGSALFEEIKLQKRVELWGEGVRFLDMKRRGEDLNRTGATNHLTTIIEKSPANSNSWIFQIPSTEMDANEHITDEENNPI